MPHNDKINKIIYQSWHRGCKETDLILGDFAKEKIPQFNDAKLELYQELIAENDWDIYAWFVATLPVPKKYQELIAEIKDFSEQKFKYDKNT